MVKGKWDKKGRYHPSESEITKGIRDVLGRSGIWHWKHWSGPLTGMKGISDLLGIYEVPVEWLVMQGIKTAGLFMACEIKRPGEKVTPYQGNFLKLVNLHHGIGFSAVSAGEVIERLHLRGRLTPLFEEKGGETNGKGEAGGKGDLPDESDRKGDGPARSSRGRPSKLRRYRGMFHEDVDR